MGAESLKKGEKKWNSSNPAQKCPAYEICFFNPLVRTNCVTFPQVVSAAQCCIYVSLDLVLCFSCLSVPLSSKQPLSEPGRVFSFAVAFPSYLISRLAHGVQSQPVNHSLSAEPQDLNFLVTVFVSLEMHVLNLGIGENFQVTRNYLKFYFEVRNSEACGTSCPVMQKTLPGSAAIQLLGAEISQTGKAHLQAKGTSITQLWLFLFQYYICFSHAPLPSL